MPDVSKLATRASLLSRLRANDNSPEAWNDFVNLYAPAIYEWCRRWRLQEADARDVTQEVLLKLMAQLRSFRYDPSRSFRAWLKTVTRHAWIDLMRSRDRYAASASPEVTALVNNLPAGEDLVSQLEHQFDIEVLAEAQMRVESRVESRTWQAYCLTAWEGLDGAEAARQLGMSVAAVYKAKSRVLQAVQAEVNRLNGDDI